MSFMRSIKSFFGISEPVPDGASFSGAPDRATASPISVVGAIVTIEDHGGPNLIVTQSLKTKVGTIPREQGKGLLSTTNDTIGPHSASASTAVDHKTGGTTTNSGIIATRIKQLNAQTSSNGAATAAATHTANTPSATAKPKAEQKPTGYGATATVAGPLPPIDDDDTEDDDIEKGTATAAPTATASTGLLSGKPTADPADKRKIYHEEQKGMCADLPLKGIALGTALTFAGNALAAGAGTSTAQLGDKDLWASLPMRRKVLAALNFTSSLWVNYEVNKRTFPIALTGLKRIFSHFGERKVANVAMLTLAITGGGIAGYIGYAGWSALLGWGAVAVGGTSTVVFMGTRLYGLTTALQRFKNYMRPDKKAEILKALARIKPEPKEIEEFKEGIEKSIHPNIMRKAQLTNQDLDKLQSYISANSRHFNQKTWSESGIELFDATWGIIAAAAALPGFTNSFLTAIEKIIAFMKLTPATDSALRPSLELEAFIGVLLSAANPILYIGSAMNIRAALFGEQRRIALEKGWFSKGSATYFLLLAANLFACSSLYNLTESTLKPNKEGEFSTVTQTLRKHIDSTMDAESTSGQVLAYLAGAASFSVNGSLAFQQAFPDNSPIGRLKTKVAVAKLESDEKHRRRVTFAGPNDTAAAPASPASSSGSATPPQSAFADAVPLSRGVTRGDAVIPASHSGPSARR